MRDTPAPIVDLAAKVAFLSAPAALPGRPAAVTVRQTHMSYVFLADGLVYKLKKAVRLPYLDFSTLALREAACRAELSVNRPLAPDVYLGVEPLTWTGRGLAIGGDGAVVDWLVVMRRLPDDRMLDRALAAGPIASEDLDRVALSLAAFYRGARRIPVTFARHLADWRRRIAGNRRALADPAFDLPANATLVVDRSQSRFLAEASSLLAERVAGRRIVDGHGDLRPEHIALGRTATFIDRLEFNPAFRIADPFDELAFLAIECDVAGRPDVGRRLVERTARALRDDIDPLLFAFYRTHRAAMRARLMVAHLAEPDGRPPGQWRPLALRYLAAAATAAREVERGLGRPRR